MLRSSLIAATLLCFAAPAGTAEPMVLRTVTLGKATGPAYYSIVEQGYRFVAALPAAVPTGEEKPVAVSALESGDGSSEVASAAPDRTTETSVR